GPSPRPGACERKMDRGVLGWAGRGFPAGPDGSRCALLMAHPTSSKYVVAALAYAVSLAILVAVPLGRAIQESGLPLTSVIGHDFGAYYSAARAVQIGESPYFRETDAGPFSLNSFYYIYP